MFKIYSATEIAEIKQLLIQEPEGGDSERFEKRPLNELIKKCDGLLHDIATRYVSSGRSIKDLKAFGAGGLLEAMIQYDEEKSGDVIYYLSKYIENAILEELGNNAAIHIPEKVRQKIKTILETRSKLMLELNRDPSFEEIGEHLGMPEGKVMELLGVVVKDSVRPDSKEEVEDYFQYEEKAVQAHLTEITEMEIQDQDDTNKKRVKEKSVPIIESKVKFLMRLSKIAHRLFPNDFTYFQFYTLDGQEYRKSIGKERVSVTHNEVGDLIVKLDEDHLLYERHPAIIDLLMRFKPNDTLHIKNNDKNATDENGLPSNVIWLDLVREYAPKVYKYQMKEFLRALLIIPEGTISNYCHDRDGVVFKEDELEPFYEKLEKYLKRTKKLSIGFGDLKQRTGKTLEEITNIYKDKKLIYPYNLDFKNKLLIRMF